MSWTRVDFTQKRRDIRIIVHAGISQAGRSPGAAVTTSIPYGPMGPWMDGCVPDSIWYAGGFGDPKLVALGEYPQSPPKFRENPLFPRLNLVFAT